MIEQLVLILVNNDITLASPYYKRLINIDFTGETLFPGIVGDDGGWDVFQCEVPICRNGDLISHDSRFDTMYEDNVLVVRMSLVQSCNHFYWKIDVQTSEDIEEMRVYEFLKASIPF